jgi:hypothetical protein
VSIAKGATISTGGLRIFDTTQSMDFSSGSLIVDGGIAVSKNVNVLGDLMIAGNLTVNGTVSNVFSTNVILGDNILVLNSGPAGSRNAGVVTARYQYANDSGAGDVVLDTPKFIDVIPSQSGIPLTGIRLSSSASSVDAAYAGWWIRCETGFSANQVRKIATYTGSTRTAVLETPWTTQTPSALDTVNLYNKVYPGLVYNESSNVFELGSTPLVDQPLDEWSTLKTNTLNLVGTSANTIAGQVQINCTVPSTSLVVAGGATIATDLNVSTGPLLVGGIDITPARGDLAPATVSVGNGATTNIAGLAFASNETWSFDSFVSARLTGTSGNKYSNFHLRGVSNANGWDLATTYVGDDTGILFSVSTSGQVACTTPTYPDFTGLSLRYRAFSL